MTDKRDVLIAGGGIGGLTAALTLHARGIRSTIIDSASELKPLGVGINLLPHAVRGLYELGVADELARVATATSSWSTRWLTGTRSIRGVTQTSTVA